MPRNTIFQLLLNYDSTAIWILFDSGLIVTKHKQIILITECLPKSC